MARPELRAAHVEHAAREAERAAGAVRLAGEEQRARQPERQLGRLARERRQRAARRAGGRDGFGRLVRVALAEEGERVRPLLCGLLVPAQLLQQRRQVAHAAQAQAAAARAQLARAALLAQ